MAEKLGYWEAPSHENVDVWKKKMEFGGKMYLQQKILQEFNLVPRTKIFTFIYLLILLVGLNMTEQPFACFSETIGLLCTCKDALLPLNSQSL